MKATGLGVDIVEVNRFRLPANSPFFTTVFSQEEIEYCKGKKNSAESFAGIFAAKEAVKKALQAEKVDFRDIAIARTENGAPSCTVKGWSDNFDIVISISHTRENAIAGCMVNKK